MKLSLTETFSRTTSEIPLSPTPCPVMDYLICLKYPLIFNILVCFPELSPLELSAFLNALPCSLAFHRDASFKFLNLIKEVRSGLKNEGLEV